MQRLRIFNYVDMMLTSVRYVEPPSTVPQRIISAPTLVSAVSYLPECSADTSISVREVELGQRDSNGSSTPSEISSDHLAVTAVRLLTRASLPTMKPSTFIPEHDVPVTGSILRSSTFANANPLVSPNSPASSSVLRSVLRASRFFKNQNSPTSGSLESQTECTQNINWPARGNETKPTMLQPSSDQGSLSSQQSYVPNPVQQNISMELPSPRHPISASALVGT
jgi:hypothetical protein